MNLYVHVPFCVSKCRYCAFRSEAGAGADRLRDFVRLLPREIALRTAASMNEMPGKLAGYDGPKGLNSGVMWVVRKNGIYLSDHYPVCAEFDFG